VLVALVLKEHPNHIVRVARVVDHQQDNAINAQIAMRRITKFVRPAPAASVYTAKSLDARLLVWIVQPAQLA
jgi:hypothetical protein